MPGYSRKLIELVILLLLMPAANADIILPRLISDGVVLQRDAEASLWGWASEGEQVTVSLNGEPITQTVASDGLWRIAMPPQSAGGPHTLEFSGTNRITIGNGNKAHSCSRTGLWARTGFCAIGGSQQDAVCQ